MKVFILVALLNITLISKAQQTDSMIKAANKLEASLKEEDAFAKFKEVLKLQPRNLYALSKCSELCSRIGRRQANTSLRDEYYEAAKIYAQTALKINPGYSDANCAMAIALGRSSMSKSGKEKVVTAKQIKNYVDASLRSNPNNFKALHVLGRWHYEVSNLNGIERAAAKLLYGALPPASLQEAIAALERAQLLSGGSFLLNYLELAKAYYRNDDTKKAIQTLKVMFNLPNRTEDDAFIKQEGKKLLNKWE